MKELRLFSNDSDEDRDPDPKTNTGSYNSFTENSSHGNQSENLQGYRRGTNNSYFSNKILAR